MHSRLTRLTFILLLPLFMQAEASGTAEHEGDQTIQLLKTLVRIDTSNPPGDTTAVATHLKMLFDEQGISNEIIVAPNGKAAHFIARLKGDGSKRPVLIASHTDVVPVERDQWSVDPYGSIEKNKFIYGRGVLDNKGAVAAFARAVIRLREEKVALTRDVIFLAEADEEQGEFNTGWLAQHHWDKIDAEFALNEGGNAALDSSGQVRMITVTTADKVTLNLKLITTGPSGHSSRPLPITATANGQLITALSKLATYETPIQLSEQTREYLKALARLNPGPFAQAVARLLDTQDPEALKANAHAVIALDNTGGWGIEGLLRNTQVLTMIDAGIKPNVIPGSAEAVLNARLLPGASIEEFIQEITRVIDNPAVRIEIVHRLPKDQVAAFFRARSRIAPSSITTDLFASIRAAAASTWPQATVAPTLFVAGTDATPWRERGIPVYGIGPFPVDRDTSTRIHGNDERVLVESVRQGSEFVYRILRNVAASAGTKP